MVREPVTISVAKFSNCDFSGGSWKWNYEGELGQVRRTGDVNWETYMIIQSVSHFCSLVEMGIREEAEIAGARIWH